MATAISARRRASVGCDVTRVIEWKTLQREESLQAEGTCGRTVDPHSAGASLSQNRAVNPFARTASADHSTSAHARQAITSTSFLQSERLAPEHRRSSLRTENHLAGAVQSDSSWKVGALYPVIPGKLYFSAHEDEAMTKDEIQNRSKLFFFSTVLHESYVSFGSDFGPVDIGKIFAFWRIVKHHLHHPKLSNRPLVYYCCNKTENLTNMAMLLASYLVVEHGKTGSEAASPFECIHPSPFKGFRDITFEKSTFDLSIRDCCDALSKAISQHWFDVSTFDIKCYEKHYHLDLSCINKKFVALAGPLDNPKASGSASKGARPAKTYVSVFQDLGVTAVIRLNESTTYNAAVFEANGVRHYDLYFPNCSLPSSKIIKKFLSICSAEPGKIAVHCSSGLGRTGTLIAIWMMQNCGFTCRESIGWLRLVRPGMVIGPQQNFLQTGDGCNWTGPLGRRTRFADLAPHRAKALARQVQLAVKNRRTAPAPSGITMLEQPQAPSFASNLKDGKARQCFPPEDWYSDCSSDTSSLDLLDDDDYNCEF